MHIRLTDVTQQVLDVVEMVVLLWSQITDISFWIVYKFYAIMVVVICSIDDVVTKGVTSNIIICRIIGACQGII